MRDGTKIHFSMYKRGKKGRDERQWGRQNALQASMDWRKKERKKKKTNPNFQGVKNATKPKSNLRIKKQVIQIKHL